MRRVHLAVTRLAEVFAIVGGLLLTCLILITCISIIGRELNALLHEDFVMSVMPGFAQWLLDLGVGSIRGDFELVEAGMAFCIFAFLPLCQITASHASVDIFFATLPTGVQRVLLAVVELLFAAALVIIALQLKEGMDRYVRSGQTSLLLQFPVWWAYALSLVGAAAAAVAGVYMAILRVYEWLSGDVIVGVGAGAEH